jgi:OPA family glycerol-3-phosphate transporter-like MFS transporter/OPA family sugar phosphate sensor protein UhpC-like MFS transporter
MIPEVAENPADTERQYRYWQNRILVSAIIGYALFYFVRKNLSVAMPAMEQALGLSKSQLGLFLTLHGLLYGVSKFLNGFVGDRMNARWMMALGLAVCAVLNLVFGMSTTVYTLGVVWMINGWFQGAGFPPCARLLTHWFSPKVLATKMSIWSSSHSLGAGLVVVLCGYLVVHGWRLCFYVPAGIALCGAFLLVALLRDTPESLGLPAIETTSEHARPPQGDRSRLVFGNGYIWLLSVANLFVYTVRYGILDWGPTFLKQARHIDLTSASWMVAAFEGCGILGMLSSGWLTDRFFGGRAARVCPLYMGCCVGALTLFWRLPNAGTATSVVLLCLAGFFTYGPQTLIGIAAANLATKRAAATAVGLTGLFGYLSTAISGVGVGWLVERYGWDAGFLLFVVAAAVGTCLFVFCWPARADGYERDVAG